jgi:hypothetical protein
MAFLGVLEHIHEKVAHGEIQDGIAEELESFVVSKFRIAHFVDKGGMAKGLCEKFRLFELVVKLSAEFFRVALKGCIVHKQKIFQYKRSAGSKSRRSVRLISCCFFMPAGLRRSFRRKPLPKKKKPKKQASSFALSREEQALLTALLDELKTANPAALTERIPGPQVAVALLENLSLDEPAALDMLTEIQKAFPQKSVHRAARKTAFKLKQRGICVTVKEHEEGPALAAIKEEPAAYVGPIDGAGNRPLLIVVPQGPSGVDLAMGAVNDEQGIIQFVYGRFGRKRMKEVKNQFFSKVPNMVKTSLSHAATVLEQAYRKEEGKPGEGAAEYLRLRPRLLEIVEPLDRPVIEDFIPLNSVTSDMLTPTQLERLLQHELMMTWMIDPEKLQPLSDEIARTRESPIFISEGQRREHMNTLVEEGVAKLLDEEKRMVFRNRLEEMAYVFFKTGEETLARLCLAAALSLEEKPPLRRISPFLSALVDRSLAQKPKVQSSSPLILLKPPVQ